MVRIIIYLQFYATAIAIGCRGAACCVCMCVPDCHCRQQEIATWLEKHNPDGNLLDACIFRDDQEEAVL